MRKQDMGNQFSKKTRKKARSIQAQRIFRSRWFKSLVAMGSVVVFCTVYSLIIPAATLTEDQASADAGIVLEEAAPSEPQPVEAPAETPAPEPVQEEAPKEGPVVQAAAAVEEAPAAASSETVAETPAEAASSASSTEQGSNESAAAGSGSEETKTETAETADTAASNETASAEETSGTAADEAATEGTDAALTTEETTEEATTETSEEPVEETTGEEEEVGTVSELKGTSGNLEALVRFAEGAGIPENATLAIYGGSADTGKVQDALWSGSMDSIEQSTITTDLSEYVSFAVKDVDGNDITPDSDCSIEISFGSEADLSDPGENRIKKYGTLLVGSDGNVSVTGTSLSTGDGHTYATFSGKLSGNTFGFAVTTAGKKVNYLESLSGKTSDGAVEASLTFGRDAKVPEGSTLTVESASVSESSVLDKLWGDYEGVNKDTVKADDIRFVKFVIRDKDGNEVRPETKISVKLTFHHEADISEAAEGFVKKHNALVAGSDGTITLGSKALSAGNGTTTATFADVSAKNAFGYAVTTAEKKAVYATRLTGKSEDGTIEASLRLTEEAKIPEGSLLKVTPVTGESVQKTLLDNIWTDTSIVDPDTIELTGSGLAAVTITDKDGNALKPEADATLTLTFNKEADLKEAARKRVKRAKTVAMTEENVKLSDDGLSAAEGKTKVTYTGIVDGQTFGYAVSTAKQKTNFLEGKLSYEGDGYTIELSVSKDNQIPEGAKLSVSELGSKSNDYQNKLDQAQEAILKEAQKKTSESVEVALNEASAHLYDISLENEDGGKIQPNGKVTVKITYDSAIQISKDESMQTVHFDENADERQVLSTKVTDETSGDSKKISAISFDTDGFSVYAVVGAAENYPDRLTYPAEDKTFTATVAGYDVAVTVPAKSFKGGVSLKASEQTWDDLTEDVQSQLTEQGVSKENSTSMDLHFEDADGTEVEPANQVSVKFTTHEEDVVNAVSSEEGTVDVFHAEETRDDDGKVQNVEVKQVASTDDNSVVSESKTKAKAEFETNSFSTFTITWFNTTPITVHLGYLSSDGKFVEFGDSYQVSSQNLTGITQLLEFIANYTVGGNNDNNTVQGIYTSEPTGLSGRGYSRNYYIGHSPRNGWYIKETKNSRYYTKTNVKNLYVVYDSATYNYAAVFYIRLNGTAPAEYHNQISVKATSDYSKGILADDSGTKVISAAQVLGENPQWTYDNGKSVNSSLLLQPSETDMFNAIKANGQTFKDSQKNTINLNNYTNAEKFFNDYEVQWYIIKLHSDGTYYTNNNYKGSKQNSSGEYSGLWHIDGVLVRKNAVWLRYRSNIEPNDDISKLTNTLIPDTSYNRTIATDSVTADVNGTWDSTNSLSVNTAPARNDGYAFLHWNTARDDSGTIYNPGDKITFSEDTTLYAIWAEPTLTVKKTFSGVSDLPANFQVEVYKGTGSDGTLFKTLSITDATKSSNPTDSNTTYTWRLSATDGVRFNDNYYVSEQNANIDEYVYTDTTEYGDKNENYVTVQRNNLAQNVATINNIYQTASSDQNYIVVQKRFVGIDPSQIPSNFSIQVNDYILTKNDAKISADGLIWTWKINGAGLGIYSISESGESITGYTLTKEGIGNSQEVKEATINYSNTGIINSNSYSTFHIEDDTFFVGSLANHGAGDVVITKNPVSASVRASIETYVRNLGSAFSSGSNIYFYDATTHGSSFTTAAGKVQYDVTNGTITFADKKVWNKVTIVSGSITSAANNPEFSIKNSYARQVTIVKQDNNNNGLAGAEFTLVKDSQEVANGKFISRADVGQTFDLANGIYELTESNAPEGYIVTDQSIYFTIDANGVALTDAAGHNKEYSSASVTTDNANGKVTITIKNTPGKALPSTGGTGTLPYTISGIAIITMAALMYGCVVRRNKQEKG